MSNVMQEQPKKYVEVASYTGHEQWQCELFPAVDLIKYKGNYRFDQPGMKGIAEREKTAIELTELTSLIYTYE